MSCLNRIDKDVVKNDVKRDGNEEKFYRDFVTFLSFRQKQQQKNCFQFSFAD